MPNLGGSVCAGVLPSKRISTLIKFSRMGLEWMCHTNIFAHDSSRSSDVAEVRRKFKIKEYSMKIHPVLKLLSSEKKVMGNSKKSPSLLIESLTSMRSPSLLKDSVELERRYLRAAGLSRSLIINKTIIRVNSTSWIYIYNSESIDKLLE